MPVDDGFVQRLASGRLHDPFLVLGRHHAADGEVVRVFLPGASRAVLVDAGEMRRVDHHGLFERVLSATEADRLPIHYRVSWRENDERWHEVTSAYSFGPLIESDDLHRFSEGRHPHAYRFLGANPRAVDGIDGCLFAVWAPGVERVSVVGEFNGWHGLRHPMRVRDGVGIWELFIPGLRAGDTYQFELRAADGRVFRKADPYARQMVLRPGTACRVPRAPDDAWKDDEWLLQRRERDWRLRPLSIYEVHPGSWRRGDDGGFPDYRALAESLVPYVAELGFTHLELLPVMEHPLDESWGYQVSGYYAPTARLGDADGLRYFVEACHRRGIGVILDWVPAHFPRDDFALARFTGEPLYEHADPRRGEHRDWGTLIFDYGRPEVRNFLIANAVYWCEEFHIDGLRVDAVASMLYLDYSRPDGEWLPNRLGGRENLEAIEFLRQLNSVIHERFPGVLMVAEESTAWPGVTHAPDHGGLGFDMKWNMGWMNDTLSYFRLDPVHRAHHHDKLTFGQLYAYAEQFLLPLSHDEVVHMKGSLLGKMPGDAWQRFAGLRLLLAWQFATPGKKLLFMGSEFGQAAEWSAVGALDWDSLATPSHAGVQRLVADLNAYHVDSSAMHRRDFDPTGFRWLECDDASMSLISFLRIDGDDHVACLFNMTPVVRDGYRVGLPAAGSYVERLNTDATCYGGSNCGNLGRVEAVSEPCMGQPASAIVTLPPLAAVFLERVSRP